jgi:hypothetical protein
MTILDALADPAIFGSAFAPAGPWAPWRTALSAAFALPLPDLALYCAATGRSAAPTAPAREAWFCVGRRGGKSRIAALVAVYLAALRDYRRCLSAGERATVALIAADRRQARTLMRYVMGLLHASPLLEQLIERCPSGKPAAPVFLPPCGRPAISERLGAA